MHPLSPPPHTKPLHQYSRDERVVTWYGSWLWAAILHCQPRMAENAFRKSHLLVPVSALASRYHSSLSFWQIRPVLVRQWSFIFHKKLCNHENSRNLQQLRVCWISIMATMRKEVGTDKKEQQRPFLTFTQRSSYWLQFHALHAHSVMKNISWAILNKKS